MKNLFSPWRSKYIDSFQDEHKNKCIFCQILESQNDDDNLIIGRGKIFTIIMNRYPYNSGHLMVISNEHKSDLKDLSTEDKSLFLKYVEFSQAIIKHCLKPDGFNIGLNIGRVAGAGVENHIHFHIVPRWNGDTNFMPILSDTKVISDEMTITLLKFKKAVTDLQIIL